MPQSWWQLSRSRPSRTCPERPRSSPERNRLLATIAHSNFTLAVPLVLAGATAALVGLCLRERRRSRRETPSPQLS
ncbi:MAG: hypothetical protein WAK71_10320 [Streptosporangiaceae bacterium]